MNGGHTGNLAVFLRAPVLPSAVPLIVMHHSCRQNFLLRYLLDLTGLGALHQKLVYGCCPSATVGDLVSQ